MILPRKKLYSGSSKQWRGDVSNGVAPSLSSQPKNWEKKNRMEAIKQLSHSQWCVKIIKF